MLCTVLPQVDGFQGIHLPSLAITKALNAFGSRPLLPVGKKGRQATERVGGGVRQESRTAALQFYLAAFFTLPFLLILLK